MKQIRYRKLQSGIYQLAEDFWIKTEVIPAEAWASCPYMMLFKDGTLKLFAGYISDGPSGPTLDSPCSIRGAFVHDAFYRLMRRGELSQSHRKAADQLIYDLCIEDGMWRIRANYWYTALRLFATKSSKFDPKDGAILVAP